MGEYKKGGKHGSAPDDGRGMSEHKGITPQESVDNQFANLEGSPGGESHKGKHIHGEGPNPGTGHVPTKPGFKGVRR